MTARGLSNRAIAARLFVTWHRSAMRFAVESAAVYGTEGVRFES
jgi:hypothetical protein